MRLSNPTRPDLPAIQADAVADRSTSLLSIPQPIATQLQLTTLRECSVCSPDGSIRRVPYVGPLLIEVAHRACYAGALVMGEHAVLGAVPMDEMDLVFVRPSTGEVQPNTASPDIARAIVKTSGM